MSGQRWLTDLVAEHLLSASDRAPLDGLRAALATEGRGSTGARAGATTHDAEPPALPPDFTPLEIGETRALLRS